MSFVHTGKRGSAEYANSIVKNNIFSNGFNVIQFTINLTIDHNVVYHLESFFLAQPYVIAIDPISDTIVIVISKDLDTVQLFQTLKDYISNKVGLTLEIKILSEQYYQYFFYCSYITSDNLLATKIIMNKIHDESKLDIIQKESIYNAFMYRYINFIHEFFDNIYTSKMIQFSSKTKNTDKIISYYLSLN